jgi:hypothetical protein
MTAHLARAVALCVGAGLFAAAGLALPSCAEDAPSQKRFASPEEAFSALVAALRANDQAASLAILGEGAKPILDSGDPVADRNGMERFVASYDEAHSIEKTSESQAELVTGKDEWPMPIPVVKEAGGWVFDTDAGDEEILARRIGRNERFAIQACLAFVDAEREYWERNPDGAALLHYARQLLSSEGKRNGLYYPTEGDEEPSPLGPGFARARAAGYDNLKAGVQTPYHGYLYRILDGQGAHAPGGAYDYVVGDHMIGGFALLASPATWDNSGVMSFLVNQDGVVYQKDLGPETEKLAAEIRSFDPDESWTRVPEADLAPQPDGVR